jgi:hypothetical protein
VLGIEGLLRRIERARSDIAIDDAQREKRQCRGRLARCAPARAGGLVVVSIANQTTCRPIGRSHLDS